jgi:hypothetical protein
LTERNSEPALLTEAPEVAPSPNGHTGAHPGECAPAPPAPAEAPAPPAELDLVPPAPCEASQAAPDNAPLSQPPTPPLAPVAALVLPPEASLLPLEDRVRRLEDALAQLQDLKGIEGRVAERVAVQLAREPPAAVPVAPPPAASTAGMLLDAGKRLLGAAATAVKQAPAEVKRAALFWEAVAEARAIVRMYVDPRYRLSWLGRLVPPGLVLLIVTSGWWVPGSSVPVFGPYFHPLLVKGIDLLLAFVLYKVLGYEARRYRETAPDLPPTLRL